MSYIWMEVTRDQYELPVAVAESAAELAEIVGTKASRIKSSISNAKRRNTRCRYVRVKLSDGMAAEASSV